MSHFSSVGPPRPASTVCEVVEMRGIKDNLEKTFPASQSCLDALLYWLEFSFPQSYHVNVKYAKYGVGQGSESVGRVFEKRKDESVAGCGSLVLCGRCRKQQNEGLIKDRPSGPVRSMVSE